MSSPVADAYWQRVRPDGFTILHQKSTVSMAAFTVVMSILFWVLHVMIHRLFRSPLSKVPGPRLTALTGLSLMYHEFTRTKRQWVCELHIKYGPVVRVAPDQVCFTSREALKEIYTSGGSGYDKTSLYDVFQNFDTPNMFSTKDKATHSEIKKRFADRYTKTFVMQPAIVSGVQENAELFLANCTRELGSSVEIYSMLQCYALDCITHNLFHPFGTRSLEGEPADVQMMEELTYHHDIQKTYYLKYHFPRLASIILPIIQANSNVKAGSAATYVLNSANNADIESHTLLHKLKGLEHELDSSAIASECMDHLVANVDAAGNMMCFILHHISLPESASVQEKLHRELADSFGAPLDSLRYLDAVVKEGLRVFFSVPMSLPRKVPSGGRIIDGFYLPEDTIVSCQPYMIHHLHTDIFPDPDTFIPERWLAEDGELERNQLFFAFSAGGRGCIAKHFAVLEMKLLLRAIYTEYRTRVAGDMAASMKPDDQFISTRPEDQKCLIAFEKTH